MNEIDVKGCKLEVYKINVLKLILIIDEESKGVDVVEGMLLWEEGDWLVVSYINYYIVNGGVVFLLFGDLNDEFVCEKLC